ncbi:phosphoadenosine phosphosulfate reductase domain-containing protein [Methanotorris formicicus]|uniref:Phosphoadenosine phosphosulfate reductase n=1 Tax=Methanotorris formicicus Mc-S-70 TaxID=647171 RepID=H1L1Q9_9EURY|nr:phosphoadenosine phosphosulfate reductase family protein [Methanotorris formicicus]EHP83378.1 phosphoadenosine phosphosulfate reductase [Methanotorris formicicus Mc-S-70]
MRTILGKMHLKWCHHCNLPVLDKVCNICRNEPVKVELTPPGDARPAFEKEIEFIENLIKEQFGTNKDILKGRIVLMNKLPGNEDMQEIIIDGQVVANLKYDNGWKIIPKLEGARRIVNANGYKKIVVIKEDVIPYLLDKSSSVLRPGVIYASEGIKKGDEVIVLKKINGKDEDVVAVGRAKMDYGEILKAEKGVVVKVRHAEEPKKAYKLKTSKKNLRGLFKDMVKANEDVIRRFEENSVGFMRNTAKKMNLPITVAYSGGKDSLTVLLLALKAFDREEFNVLFTDTGLEFEETLKNVDIVQKTYNIRLIKEESNEFWEKLEEYGPPGRDYRWCSEICKLKPLKRLIDKHYPNGTLTFVGLRKYESFNRAKKPRIQKNPNIPKQINAMPIHNWSAMHVWLYLFKNNAPYNKMYEKGFDRVGCYVCPAMELGEIDKVKREYPELWEKWEEFLKKWAKKVGYDEKWIEGLWRWKNPKIKNKNNKL